MKIDWARKLSSRKLWIAIAGFVSGLIMVFGGTETMASTVSGVILQGAAVLGYLIAAYKKGLHLLTQPPI